MKRIKLLGAAAFFITSAGAQNLPAFGVDSLLDVGAWNIEWFGDPSNGPSDESLQFTNVKKVLQSSNIDVWGIEEMSDNTAYSNLNVQLSGIYESVISTFSQTQKTCLYYRKTMFELLPSLTGNVLTDPTYDYSFAGRPPLKVALRMKSLSADTLYFFVLHMKAYADADSYARRKQASVYLKSWLESNMGNKKYFVLGDWNDDLDESIYSHSESPYKNFVDAFYLFPTRELTNEGKHSTYNGSAMIDHMMLSHSMESFYLQGSAHVFDNASAYIGSYGTTTSDHFPVYAFFDWTKMNKTGSAAVVTSAARQTVRIFPNPAVSQVFAEGLSEAGIFYISDQLGHLLITAMYEPGHPISVAGLEAGIYYVRVQTASGSYLSKVVVGDL
jgi:endonuclease/exonuclease/phosphatase family metal-dependent hydrolase